MLQTNDEFSDGIQDRGVRNMLRLFLLVNIPVRVQKVWYLHIGAILQQKTNNVVQAIKALDLTRLCVTKIY